jgi:long-chain acyl-CoA synthetase
MNTPWLNNYDDTVPHHINYPEITLHQILDQVAGKYPQKTAVIWNGNIYSYAQIKLYSDNFSVFLRKSGLQKGDRVAIVLPNSPHFIVCYYGILKAGGVVVALNPAYKEQEIRHIIHSSESKFVIVDVHNEIILAGNVVDKEQTAIIHVLATEANLDVGFPWNIHASSGKLMKPEWTVTPDDPAVYQYTGGTTGVPKAAVGLHRNLVANSYQFRNWLHVLEDGKEVVLAAIPLFHVYGMVIAMAMGMTIGAAIVIPANPRDPKEVLRLMVDQRVTVFPGVPAQYYALTQLSEVSSGQVDLSFMKVCISGSAPLNPELKKLFESLTGATIFEGYGLSEAPTATHCNPIQKKNKPGSIGLPLPDVNCKIVSLDDRSVELSTGKIGELVLQSPQVMAGYHNAQQESSEALVDDWLYTGDIARMDEDGYFYIIDRKKDLIKVGGLQVWPREIEEVISTHPMVTEVGVAGIPGKYSSEVVKAWVVLKDSGDKNISEESIKAWCVQRLAFYKCPSQVEFMEKLPRSSIGKLLRKDLVRSHLERYPL